MAVYQTVRQGTVTYTIPNLTAGASYTVRLHFAELYFTTAGDRAFDVAINGAAVLTNFDIYKTAGAQYTAVVENFTATANISGQIVIAFTNGTVDQPMFNGIEVLGSSTSSCTTVPSAPTGLTATASSSSAIGLSWTAVTPPANCAISSYTVYGGTTANPTTLIASGLTGTTYSNTGLAASKTYYYVVKAVDADGTSAASAQAQATTPAASCATVPPAPTGVTVSGATSSSLIVSWTAVTPPVNCTTITYRVYGGTTANPTTLIATGLTGASYTDTGLAASTTYYFLVEAVDADGTSTPSTQASAKTLASGSGPVIATQPASQTVTIGTTATFTVIASGTGPFTYQWQKIAANTNTAVPISGATSSSYNTPTTSAPDNGAAFNVVVTNAGGSVTSANAVMTVNSSPAYTVYPGFIGTDLNNNTHGAWADSQIYIVVLGANVTTNALSWVNYDGTVNAASIADNTASNAVTGPDGKTYPHYFFTLAQSNHFLKLPPLNAARIFVSLGSPVFIPIMAGNPLGYAGPNPLNPTDPNVNVYYDWYEFDWGGGTDAMFINTTQVDMFGLPLTLDLWGTSETFHQQTGITESVAALDQEFTNQTPATFQAGQSPISPLRIWAPAHMTFETGGANGNYFESYVNSVWAEYATTPLTVLMDNNSHEYTGTTSGTTFNFTEVNLNNGAYAGPGTYTINEPTTQDILLCDGSMATGTGVTAALEAQFCAAFNRHVMDNYANWTNVPSYYQTAPTNYYSAFWHNHSIAGLSYGFAYDDVNNQSSSIVGAVPEHMAFGISW